MNSKLGKIIITSQTQASVSIFIHEYGQKFAVKQKFKAVQEI